MSPIVAAYLAYVALGVALVVWVAAALRRYGEVFLIDVFDGHEDLARAVNRLLVIGFYLLNFGYVAFALRTTDTVADARAAIETLSAKVGGVLLVLGVLHLGNVFVLSRVRRRRLIEQQPNAPLAATYWTPPGGGRPGGPGVGGTPGVGGGPGGRPGGGQPSGQPHPSGRPATDQSGGPQPAGQYSGGQRPSGQRPGGPPPRPMAPPAPA
jgi:hypothetical protein